MERTEEQKLTQGPVKVILGGKEYEIKPLPLIESTPWRKRFIALMSNISELAKVTDKDGGKFLAALSNILTEKPDELIALFFEYSKLNRTEIESVATSFEMLHAIEEVVNLESPFLGASMRITQAMTRNLA